MMFHIKNCFQFSVDFTKYPIFHEVEFHEAKMESGDCLFIPFKWYACFIMICILYKCHTSCLVCHFCFGPPPVHVVFLRVNTLRENPTHTGLLLFSGITKWHQLEVILLWIYGGNIFSPLFPASVTTCHLGQHWISSISHLLPKMVMMILKMPSQKPSCKFTIMVLPPPYGYFSFRVTSIPLN